MSRSGFTLVEVVVALVILAVGILGMAASAGRLSRMAATAEREARAMEAVHDRLALVMLHPQYGGLDTLFTATETELQGLPDFTRTTEITRVQEPGVDGRVVDYTVIEVVVAGPLLDGPVIRAAVVGAP